MSRSACARLHKDRWVDEGKRNRGLARAGLSAGLMPHWHPQPVEGRFLGDFDHRLPPLDLCILLKHSQVAWLALHLFCKGKALSEKETRFGASELIFKLWLPNWPPLKTFPDNLS